MNSTDTQITYTQEFIERSYYLTSGADKGDSAKFYANTIALAFDMGDVSEGILHPSIEFLKNEVLKRRVQLN